MSKYNSGDPFADGHEVKRDEHIKIESYVILEIFDILMKFALNNSKVDPQMR